MPNHCETDMYIRGSDEDVTAFDYSGSRGG